MRVALFGAGSGLRDLLSVLPAKVDVVGIFDNDRKKHGGTAQGHPVFAPETLPGVLFDYVVITGRNGEEMRAQLLALGIERKRILLFYSGFDRELRRAVNQDMDVLNKHLGLGLHPLSLCTMQMRPDGRTDELSYEDDFCRKMAIRLAADRIARTNVPGAIAELGVYKGETAAMLNGLFPDRTLYLFDTFEGFSGKDLADGAEAGHSHAEVGDFEDTNLDLVLARMSSRERVVVRKGYFPETLGGLEETFAFVSLDVDLYKPIMAGLQYFYPRLAPGGCLFVHDYNNRRFQGAQAAVDEFVKTTGAPLVELPDIAGSAVLPK